MTLEQAIQEHIGKLPAQLQGEVLDYVLYLEQKAQRQVTDAGQRRQRATEALERVVSINPFRDADPTAWERDQRQERSLPGRG